MNNTYNMNRVVKFFDFKTFYTLFELEFKKNQMVSNNNVDITTVNERYEEALGIKKEFTVSKTKLSYKDIIIMDLYTLKNGLIAFKDNKLISILFSYVENVEKNVRNEENEENLKKISLNFSENYYDVVKKIVEEYKNNLITTNSLDDNQLNRLDFFTKDNVILSVKLDEIIKKLDNIVKSNEEEIDIENDKQEEINLIDLNDNSDDKQLNYVEKSLNMIDLKDDSLIDDDSNVKLKSIKDYSEQRIQMIDFSRERSIYYDRALAYINMCIDGAKRYLHKEELKSIVGKYYSEIDTFFVNILYEFSKKIAKEQINDNKEVSEIIKKYLSQFGVIFNNLCNEINTIEKTNLITNYNDIPSIDGGILQK